MNTGQTVQTQAPTTVQGLNFAVNGVAHNVSQGLSPGGNSTGVRTEEFIPVRVRNVPNIQFKDK